MKLKEIGFSDPLLSWFISVLTQRSQFVKNKIDVLDFISLMPDDLSGDYLFPLLFNLLINYINGINNMCLLYIILIFN